METVEEEIEYSWREVALPQLIPVVAQPELEREPFAERRRGRTILVAVDHGPNSVGNQVVYDASHLLMEKLAVEAFQVAMVKTEARIVEGDAGKVICREAERLKPAAVVMGTRGRSLINSVLLGSVSEYCVHHCKAAPVVIVPGKGLIQKLEKHLSSDCITLCGVWVPPLK